MEPDPQPTTAPELEILYDERPCLVINKPSGLLTQAPPNIDSVEARVKDLFRQREQKTGKVYAGVPHRLDRPASGAIVMARHVRATRRLAEQFETRRVRKIYWIVVEGDVATDSGTWTDTIRKVPNEPQAEVVAADHPEARSAVLRYRVLGKCAAGSWLEIELETGRYHQIRIQAASRGWPIVGDTQYGAQLTFGEQFEDHRLRAIALHARLLGFEHPMTREPIEVTAPLPTAWQSLDLPLETE
jgi:23S rRNA pseudouridine1911/1915/1917 synthase